MIQKVTSLEHMRGLIQHRYEDDKILGLYTAITLIGFNFIFMVIFAPSDAITLLNLGNYASYFLTMGLNLSVATAFFIVISRVPSHVKRDNELIDAVAGCLYELNVEGSEELLAYKDRTFKYKIFGLLSFVLMALVLVLDPLRMEYEIFTYLNPQDSTLNFVLPAIYSVVCMYPIFIFPLRHDRRAQHVRAVFVRCRAYLRAAKTDVHIRYGFTRILVDNLADDNRLDGMKE